tara:strand:- start:442 stop:1170 length:729 start_codon:yes stop_codon:yes gene_type:complete
MWVLILLVVILMLFVSLIPTPKYVVSISTIPSRINKIQPIINSFLNQTYKPHRIYIHIPNKYNRFTETIDKIPDFLTKNPKVVINRIPVDFGPASKLFGMFQTNYKGIILVTDDDSVKKPNWAQALIRNIKKNPNSVSTIHPNLIFGYKGFGMYSDLFDRNDIINTFHQKKESCILVDDDFLTHYCKLRNIHVNFIRDPFSRDHTSKYTQGRELPFGDKLIKLGGENTRSNLRTKCKHAFFG